MPIFQAACCASLPFVLTPRSTITVPATREIYYASLQAEGYPQATSQPPRPFTRPPIGPVRLTAPGPAEACSGGREQADFGPQGHGCAVQGDEVAASFDVQLEAGGCATDRPPSSAQAGQGRVIPEASNCSGEASEGSSLCCHSKAAFSTLQCQ